jgi:hypothetical protein
LQVSLSTGTMALQIKALAFSATRLLRTTLLPPISSSLLLGENHSAEGHQYSAHSIEEGCVLFVGSHRCCSTV